MSEVTAEGLAQTAPAATAVAKIAKVKVVTGNLIHDVAAEIEGLGKVKALHQADKLALEIETNYFKFGGLLKLIAKEQWFEGYPTFDAFVLEKFGFAKRKADYLIAIYTALVDKQIPWEKVGHLGWTKLKDLAPVLTPENVDEWVGKAEKLTVMELMALLKAPAGAGSGETTTTTTDIVKVKFALHADQAEQVNLALAKAKGEMSTDHDNVALSAICTGYLANSSSVASPPVVALDEMFANLGYEKVLEVFEKVFPQVNLEVSFEPAAA